MVKMSLSIYMKGYYEEFHSLRRRENKANSKPIPSGLRRWLKNCRTDQSQLDGFGRKSGK
jgi:hypothetical protein